MLCVYQGCKLVKQQIFGSTPHEYTGHILPLEVEDAEANLKASILKLEDAEAFSKHFFLTFFEKVQSKAVLKGLRCLFQAVILLRNSQMVLTFDGP